MNESKTMVCGSCGEAAPLSASLCPLCEGPTGFDWRTRLGKRGIGALAAGVLLVWSGAYLVGNHRAERAAAESYAAMQKDAQLDPAELEDLRLLERARQAAFEREVEQLLQRRAASKERVAELARLRAELAALPSRADVARAKRARDKELLELREERR